MISCELRRRRFFSSSASTPTIFPFLGQNLQDGVQRALTDYRNPVFVKLSLGTGTGAQAYTGVLEARARSKAAQAVSGSINLSICIV